MNASSSENAGRELGEILVIGAGFGGIAAALRMRAKASTYDEVLRLR